MGARYISFRIWHEIEKRLGILKVIHPQNPKVKRFVSLSEWKEKSYNIFSFNKLCQRNKGKDNPLLKTNAARILSGEIQFFNYEWKLLGKNFDWVSNPENGYIYDVKSHWSEIDDFSTEAGDIKYVWEKSRFSYLLTIIRNDFQFGEDHSAFVFSEIESWIDGNPINQGPNWRCSQEISLRNFNWTIALAFYKDSRYLTEPLWEKIQNVFFWSLHHVYHHINFSRIAVRNNHAITETLFLALSNILFPFIPETIKWSRVGKKMFEKEIDYQIYDDGSFLQFSMNYQRVVVQLLSMGIAVTGANDKGFSEIVYRKAYKCLDFLYQNLQDENGRLPNYGANDGALFFPLSDCEYVDYRPQINSLHFLLTGNYLFDEEEFKEDLLHFFCYENFCSRGFPPLQKIYGKIEFPIGGYYLIREPDCFTFIKCGSYKDRPSHSDCLHIDIWHKGENVLCDGGTFQYNTKEEYSKYFTGTESHNTVMLEHFDQMQKGPRFIWYYWPKVINITFIESGSSYRFEGTVSCYSYLRKNIKHKRIVSKNKNILEWKIVDEIINKPKKLLVRQLWHTCDNDQLLLSSDTPSFRKIGWRSLYYGVKEETSQIEFKTKSSRLESIIKIL